LKCFGNNVIERNCCLVSETFYNVGWVRNLVPGVLYGLEREVHVLALYGVAAGVGVAAALPEVGVMRPAGCFFCNTNHFWLLNTCAFGN